MGRTHWLCVAIDQIQQSNMSQRQPSFNYQLSHTVEQKARLMGYLIYFKFPHQRYPIIHIKTSEITSFFFESIDQAQYSDKPIAALLPALKCFQILTPV